MFTHTATEDGIEGTVVGYRKAAVDAYVLVDTGSGDYVQATVTRSRFDTMGLAFGSRVLVDGEGGLHTAS